jgi:two-component system, chemotaxis family, CheB/CheR fusion protein
MHHANSNARPRDCGDDDQPTQPLATSLDAGAASIDTVIYVVDDEFLSRKMICDLIEDGGWTAEPFDSCELFLAAYLRRPGSCIILDIHFPGMSGLELLEQIEGAPEAPPVIMVSGTRKISEAVRSMRDGALDFLEKPIDGTALISSVQAALSRSQQSNKVRALRHPAVDRAVDLTERQRQIMDLVLAGHPSKNIAADIGISQRTVEAHRSTIMKRMAADSLPALARIVMCNVCPLVR